MKLCALLAGMALVLFATFTAYAQQKGEISSAAKQDFADFAKAVEAIENLTDKDIGSLSEKAAQNLAARFMIAAAVTRQPDYDAIREAALTGAGLPEARINNAGNKLEKLATHIGFKAIKRAADTAGKSNAAYQRFLKSGRGL